MIPEAAVEAAVEAHCEGTMRAALEAALPLLLEVSAPHMLAEAWEEGFDYARNESWTPEANPYRTAE